jgi:hypothetical protein
MTQRTVSRPLDQPLPEALSLKLADAVKRHGELREGKSSVWFEGGQEKNIAAVRQFFDALAKDKLLHEALVKGPNTKLKFTVGNNPSGYDNAYVTITPRLGMNAVRIEVQKSTHSDPLGYPIPHKSERVTPEKLGSDKRIEAVRASFEESVEKLVKEIEQQNERLSGGSKRGKN